MKKKSATKTTIDNSPRKLFSRNSTKNSPTNQLNTEQSLPKSEEKYRTLFDSIDEGFCIIEIIYDQKGTAVDYQYLEVNQVFERQTGRNNVIGKLSSELAPEKESYWLEYYARVAQTGEPIRFEKYHKETGRWYQVYASRIAGSNNQVAVVFDDITERKRREDIQNFLMEIRDDFTHLNSAEEIMQGVGAKVGAFLNVPYCHFMAIDEERDEVIFLCRWNADEVLPLPDTVRLSEQISEDFRRLAHSGATVVSNDTGINPITNGKANAAINAIAFITVSFIKNGEWKYQFSVHDAKPREWRQDEVELVTELANQFFPRLERAFTEEALRKSEEKYRTLFDSIEEGFCIIEVIYNDLGKPIDYRFIEANPAFYKQTGLENAIGKTILELVPNHEKIWFKIYGEIALTGVPASFEQQAKALDRWFEVYAFRIGEPEQKRVAVLFRDIAERKQIEKIERDKEILRKLVIAQEIERKRIARNLHDELGQQLTTLRLKLENVRKSYQADSPLQKQIDDIQLTAKKIDDGVDFLAWELRPAALDDLGLVAALNKYVSEWSHFTGIPAVLLTSKIENLRFEPEIETNLYRIAQEALNNIHKHAGAKSVEVFLQRRAEEIILIISDDGRGFKYEGRKSSQKSIGLIGIQERAQLIGGSLEIEAAPDKGVSIYVRVPAELIQQKEESDE